MVNKKRIDNLEAALGEKPGDNFIVAWYDVENPELFEVNGRQMTEAEIYDLAGVVLFMPRNGRVVTHEPA